MCGRCACSYQSKSMSLACQYKDSSGKYREAQWIPSEVDDIQYNPSYNLGPRSVLPIVTSGSHFNRDDKRIICPMLWGMIPPWHQGGDYRKHKMSTHNARLEDLEKSKMYLPPLRQGKRCIAVVEGYYEWKRDGSTKQPYYIYATQKADHPEDRCTLPDDSWYYESGWQGPNLLKLAGIFNSFKTETGQVVYSFSMLTREANNHLSWLHHRTPVFLSTENQVEEWLNYNDTHMDKALDNLRRYSTNEYGVYWHPVSTAVNSVFYQNKDCIQRIELEKMEEKKKRPTGLMASWLSGASSKRKAEDSDNLKSDEEAKTARKKE